MVQLSATMEQTCEMQLAKLYDVLGLRRGIARYDVYSMKLGPDLYCIMHALTICDFFISVLSVYKKINTIEKYKSYFM